MSEIVELPAPNLSLGAPDDEWNRERRAFDSLLPSLLATHRGKYVAIHGGQVVAEGTDKIAVARLAYGRVGYRPVYVGLVGGPPRPPVRLPSPRLLRGTD